MKKRPNDGTRAKLNDAVRNATVIGDLETRLAREKGTTAAFKRVADALEKERDLLEERLAVASKKIEERGALLNEVGESFFFRLFWRRLTTRIYFELNPRQFKVVAPDPWPDPPSKAEIEAEADLDPPGSL
jgi:hypothetical protein